MGQPGTFDPRREPVTGSTGRRQQSALLAAVAALLCSCGGRADDPAPARPASRQLGTEASRVRPGQVQLPQRPRQQPVAAHPSRRTRGGTATAVTGAPAERRGDRTAAGDGPRPEPARTTTAAARPRVHLGHRLGPRRRRARPSLGGLLRRRQRWLERRRIRIGHGLVLRGLAGPEAAAAPGLVRQPRRWRLGVAGTRGNQAIRRGDPIPPSSGRHRGTSRPTCAGHREPGSCGPSSLLADPERSHPAVSRGAGPIGSMDRIAARRSIPAARARGRAIPMSDTASATSVEASPRSRATARFRTSQRSCSSSPSRSRQSAGWSPSAIF